MKNPIVYWELASHNGEESADFFKNVFEWDFHKDSLNIYETDAGNTRMEYGGIFTLKKAKLPFITLYIKVDSVDKTALMIEKFGGFIVIEPFDVDSNTRICLFNEPSGVTFAIIEKK